MANVVNKKRWRNYALWVSLISQFALLVQLIGLATGHIIPQELIEGWVAVANVVLGILSTLGIISNPTKPNSKGYNL